MMAEGLLIKALTSKPGEIEGNPECWCHESHQISFISNLYIIIIMWLMRFKKDSNLI